MATWAQEEGCYYIALERNDPSLNALFIRYPDLKEVIGNLYVSKQEVEEKVKKVNTAIAEIHGREGG